MPIERYRDISEMPRPPRPSPERLLEAIAATWERAQLRGAPDFFRGVQRFRSLEEAQAARQKRTIAHLRRLRSQTAER